MLQDTDQISFLQMLDDADEVGSAIAELKQKLEDVKASHYAEMVDAGMRERRMRRALCHNRKIKKHKGGEVMCEYCEDGKEMEIYGACIHTFIVNKKPAIPQIVEYIAMEDGVFTNSISINYCPMCGRKLEMK